jgi:aspartyl-tRNA(Asn)/glutamyl-tRNA(Gln) amidotransferase subunit A
VVSARASFGLYAQPISFIGLPVVVVPVVRPGEPPVGVQLIGAPWSEPALLAIAHRLEREGIVGAGPLPAALEIRA